MSWLMTETEKKLPELKRIETPQNPISFAFRIEEDDAKVLGSMLFTRGLTGHRVCEYTGKKTEDGFVNWGQVRKEKAPFFFFFFLLHEQAL
jgi:hypothetical protein